MAPLEVIEEYEPPFMVLVTVTEFVIVTVAGLPVTVTVTTPGAPEVYWPNVGEEY